MTRGKDIKPRKKDLYSISNSIRVQAEGYSETLKKSITASRVGEKDIPDNTELLSYNDTIDRIRALGKWTQGTNRKIYLDKPLLKSIYFYSKDFIVSTNKISELIYGLLYGNNSVCPKCNSLLHFAAMTTGYTPGCSNMSCSNAKSKGAIAIKEKLGDIEYAKYLLNKIKTFSEEWFQQKYGDEYKQRHIEYKEKMKKVALNNLMNFGSRTSKAANTFFDKLYAEGIHGKYSNNGGEKVIHLNDFSVLNRHIIFLDFVYKNIIIEYDGDYFHDEDIDNKRDAYLREKNYVIYRIKHSECKSISQKKKQLYDCIQFIKDHENK